jgi:hypothetical protein
MDDGEMPTGPPSAGIKTFNSCIRIGFIAEAVAFPFLPSRIGWAMFIGMIFLVGISGVLWPPGVLGWVRFRHPETRRVGKTT